MSLNVSKRFRLLNQSCMPICFITDEICFLSETFWLGRSTLAEDRWCALGRTDGDDDIDDADDDVDGTMMTMTAVTTMMTMMTMRTILTITRSTLTEDWWCALGGVSP